MFHESVEKERNALAHGHLGVYSLLPDGILWLSTKDYLPFKARIILKQGASHTPERREWLNSRLSFYQADDLNAIADDIDTMGWIWSSN